LLGVLSLCDAEDWPTFPAEPGRAHAVLTAPGVSAVSASHRRQGIGRALLEYAVPLTGAQRVDLVTDAAEDFYRSFDHRTFAGFRICP
jgi:GNAT superfamily N-acetyltransferase